MIVYAVRLNDGVVAVATTEARASKMADAVKANEPLPFARLVSVEAFHLDNWPRHWAGEES